MYVLSEMQLKWLLLPSMDLMFSVWIAKPLHPKSISALNWVAMNVVWWTLYY
jgi:hypothetical protein